MPSPQEELDSISQILHLAYHRNKNQHRLAKWWKAFSMLRRNISKLGVELQTSTSYTSLSAKSKKTIEAREIVERRVAFLEDHLVPRAYLAFSQLVADNQYAALGLMLMGTLARVKKVMGPLRGERAVNEEAAKLEGQDEGHDFGEVVKRDEVLVEVGRGKEQNEEDGEDAVQLKKSKRKNRSDGLEATKVPGVHQPAVTKRTKKKRKKGDALDDLFDSLI